MNGARILVFAVSWIVAATGCAATDVELLPDGGTGDAGEGSGVEGCFDDEYDCSACPPEPCGDDCCEVACGPAGACTVGVSEASGGTATCDDATACGAPADAFDYCRGTDATCILNASEAATVVCLAGRCRVSCSAPCQVECPNGGCLLDCPAGGCSFVDCPLAQTNCPGDVVSCGADCAA